MYSYMKVYLNMTSNWVALDVKESVAY